MNFIRKIISNFSRRQWWIIGTAGAVILIFMLVFSGIIPGLTREEPKEIEINFLGVDEARVWRPIIEKYREEFPYIKINYQKANRGDYEQILLNRLAADNPLSGQTGPDIFMFHSAWLPKHFDKLAPATGEQFNANRFESLFPAVAVQDFAPDGVVFASPLYIDTLALYYNKNLFDEGGVASIPKTWLKFQETIEKLNWPAAAIGGSSNSISKASDLLNNILLQSGAPMTDQYFSRAMFGNQGRNAFGFYLSFVNPENEFYSWNDQQPLDINLFSRGKLPVVFHYKQLTDWLVVNNPALNFGVASMPQPSSLQSRVSYADYFGLAVSNKSSQSEASWNFIKFITTNPEVSQIYLSSTNRSPALRSVIQQLIKEQPSNPFPRQSLIARSWPRVDDIGIKRIFNQAIQKVLAGGVSSNQALAEAEQKITNLMRKR